MHGVVEISGCILIHDGLGHRIVLFGCVYIHLNSGL
jgi:hypothetical protein